MTIDTRYTVRLTQASNSAINSYVIKPDLNDFSDQLATFHQYFQFFRIKQITLGVENTINVPPHNLTTAIYQLPYLVLTAVRNADLPSSMQEAMALKTTRQGVFSRKFQMRIQPYVQVSTGIWQASPLLNTKDGATKDHLGFSLWLERQGYGYTYDFIMTVSATLCFYQYDGPQAQNAVQYEQVKPTKRENIIKKEQEEPAHLRLIAQQEQLRRRLEALAVKGGK